MKAAVIVPTFNEVDNLKQIVEQILSVYDMEIVIVDDASPDGTGELADELAKSYNIRVVHRSGKLGLSSAILEGFKATDADIVGVIDADLQHPPEMIPKLVEPIKSSDADIVIASRKVKGGGMQGWPAWRKLVSWGAGILARPLTPVKDPMSGFFFLKSTIISDCTLDTIGFKMGLEILIKSDYDKVLEVPYIFQTRKRGESKLTGGEFINYINHLLRLYRYRLGL